MRRTASKLKENFLNEKKKNKKSLRRKNQNDVSTYPELDNNLTRKEGTTNNKKTYPYQLQSSKSKKKFSHHEHIDAINKLK